MWLLGYLEWCRYLLHPTYTRTSDISLFWVQIANRIKSKGLQKLRWYCQMCQKQCRDENGFKCHLTSESHKRQMQVFGEAPERGIAMTLVQKQRSVYKSLA